MSNSIRVVQFGLGPIGSAIARHIVERHGLTLVGAVDIDPTKVGKDAGEVIRLDRPLGYPVRARVSEVLDATGAEVAVHATGSYFDLFKHQVIELLEAGLDVVSSAEELSFPWLAHPREAAQINSAAKRAGKTVLGTGVNPGFLMDSLPLALTAICQRVDRISITRAQNASLRRGPFQAKIGSGMTVDAFQTKMAEGRMGHVGLPESMGMLFSTLGKKLARYECRVEPVVAETRIKTQFFDVPPGRVCGLKQVARGHTEDNEFVTLTFIAALDWPVNEDTIQITGKPDLEITLRGTNGDVATVAIVVNAIRRVQQAGPGLVTMCDLPIVTLW